MAAAVASIGGPNGAPMTKTLNAASRPETALGTSGPRAIAPPSSRISTIASGAGTSGPAAASRASTAAAGSASTATLRSRTGMGSVGSMCTASTAA